MTRTLTTTLLAPCFILLAGSAGASPPIRNASHEVAPVAIANRAATIEPTAQGFINAVQVYPFTDGAIYRVITAPERVTDIALQPGETLVAVASGDTVRWVIGDTTSGSGTEGEGGSCLRSITQFHSLPGRCCCHLHSRTFC